MQLEKKLERILIGLLNLLTHLEKYFILFIMLGARNNGGESRERA